MKRTLPEIQEELTKTHQQALAVIAEHVAKLQENPHSAMTWSMRAFSAAGILRHTTWMMAGFDPANFKVGETEPDVKLMVASLKSAIRHGAHYPVCSTSATSNIVEQEELSAAVTLLEDVFGIRIDSDKD